MASSPASDEPPVTRTFADALNERYADPLSDCAEELVVGQPGFNRKVDFLLPSAPKGIEQLTKRIALSGMQIDAVGDVSEETAQRLRQVKELDLSRNALPNWPVVAEIVAKVPACEELIVSGNSEMAYPADFPYAEVIQFKKSLRNVRTIVMAECGYEWQWVICAGLEVWPQSLICLNLHSNHVTEVTTPPPHCFPDLQSLDLSGNPLTDWNQVCKLGALPALRELNVSDCHLQMVSFDGAGDSDAGRDRLFPALKKLNLSGNELDSWIDVSELRRLTGLQELNLKGNPLISRHTDYASAFNQVLGRLTGLLKLNGEQVTEEMYREAEKYYLKLAFKDSANRDSEKEFASLHPRFRDLLQIYGEPQVAPARPKHVCLSLLAEDGNEITKKLPYSTTISSLKVLMKRTFGLDPASEIDLVLKTRKEDDYEYLLSEDENPLSYYDVGNDDVILLKTK